MAYRNPVTKQFSKPTATQCVVKDQTPEQRHEAVKRTQHGRRAKRRLRQAQKRRVEAKKQRQAKKRDKVIRSQKSLGENEFAKTFNASLRGRRS